MNTKIIGTGSAVPSRVLDNAELSTFLDTSDEWIRTRTGIRSRHIAQEGQTASALAAQAAKKAIADAGIAAEQIEAIIVATSTPDYIFPSTANLVQQEIGAERAACFDLSAACTGFLYAMSVADAYIKAGMYKKVLVIGAEVMSQVVDWKDRSVCVLFGDGAGAVVLGEDSSGKSIFRLHSDSGSAQALTLGKENAVHMNGREIFSFAVRKVPESVKEVLEESETAKEQVKYFILHQANARMIESIAKRLDVPVEKFPMNLETHGNTSAASIPVLLDELNRQNRLIPGDVLILSGFGGGLSWGSAGMAQMTGRICVDYKRISKIYCSRMEIKKMLEKMKEIIAGQLNVNAEDVKPESRFKEDLNADSLDLFELVMALEDEYSVEIPSEELEKLLTVQDVCDYLKNHGVEA